MCGRLSSRLRCSRLKPTLAAAAVMFFVSPATMLVIASRTLREIGFGFDWLSFMPMACNRAGGSFEPHIPAALDQGQLRYRRRRRGDLQQWRRTVDQSQRNLDALER